MLALYDRMEQLESENDLMKSELLSISDKFEHSEEALKRSASGFSNSSSSQKQVKIRKERVKTSKDDKDVSEIILDPIKNIAATINSPEFDYKPNAEKERILSAMDDDAAVETISWAILNSGRIPHLRREIDF